MLARDKFNALVCSKLDQSCAKYQHFRHSVQTCTKYLENTQIRSMLETYTMHLNMKMFLHKNSLSFILYKGVTSVMVQITTTGLSFNVTKQFKLRLDIQSYFYFIRILIYTNRK